MFFLNTTEENLWEKKRNVRRSPDLKGIEGISKYSPTLMEEIEKYIKCTIFGMQGVDRFLGAMFMDEFMLWPTLSSHIFGGIHVMIVFLQEWVEGVPTHL